jgi:hypothetical protein
VVLVNDSAEARSARFDLAGVKASTFEIYRTSGDEDLRLIHTDKKAGPLYLAPKSVTTIYGY